MTVPSLARVFERAGDRHAVHEAGVLGEEAAHLQFRIDARRAAGGSP